MWRSSDLWIGIRGCQDCLMPQWTRVPTVWTVCAAATFCNIRTAGGQEPKPVAEKNEEDKPMPVLARSDRRGD